MANTLIQLKHSTVTSIPPSLNTAEPAYSFTSNTLFIGLNGSVLNVGGVFYTSQIDNATNLATPNTLVERDASGNASFNAITANTINATINGNANSATQLQTPRFFNFSGDVDAVSASFNGTANANFTLELTNTGVTQGTYGGATNIPVITVDVDGRVTSAANVSVATNLNIAADTGTNVISLLSDTITFVGGDGITTSIGPTDNVRFDVDNTVIRTTGNQTITGDFTLNGNLNVQGNTVTYGVTSYVVDDPIVLYANNNTGNVVDLGFVAHYVENATTKHTGLVRDVSSSTWYLFENYGPHIQEDHVLNIANPTLVVSNLKSNIIDGTIYNGTINGLATDLAVKDGGTGQSSFTAGQIIIGNGTGGLLQLANTSSSGTYANASHVPVITVDAYGRVSSVTNTAISISTTQVTSGTLPIARGGTNQTSFTTGQRLVFDGTSLASQANTTTTVTGGLSAANTITSLTINAYGDITAYTGAAIAIGASQITSGTLGVARGGTGATTFTTNGVLLGQGTNAITTVSSSTQGHILTINASGVPVFEMLSGGTF
jgi:trimeric autotransporter adhesin